MPTPTCTVDGTNWPPTLVSVMLTVPVLGMPNEKILKPPTGRTLCHVSLIDGGATVVVVVLDVPLGAVVLLPPQPDANSARTDRRMMTVALMSEALISAYNARSYPL